MDCTYIALSSLLNHSKHFYTISPIRTHTHSACLSLYNVVLIFSIRHIHTAMDTSVGKMGFNDVQDKNEKEKMTMTVLGVTMKDKACFVFGI